MKLFAAARTRAAGWRCCCCRTACCSLGDVLCTTSPPSTRPAPLPKIQIPGSMRSNVNADCPLLRHDGQQCFSSSVAEHAKQRRRQQRARARQRRRNMSLPSHRRKTRRATSQLYNLYMHLVS